MDKMTFIAVIAALFALRAVADGFSAGIGASNAQCGTGVPTAYVDYDRDSDEVSAHFVLRTGPNGSCEGQGTSVDAQVSKRHELPSIWLFHLIGGYDQRVVPFEYEPAATKQFQGVEVVTVTGAVSFGAGLGDCFEDGDEAPCWTVGLVYNAIEQDFEDGGGVSPISVVVSGRVGPFEFDASLMERGIGTFDVTWENERIRAAVRASNNQYLLDNPAPTFLEDATTGHQYARLGSPPFVYAFDCGWRF